MSIEEFTHEGLLIRIEQDESPENPRQWDNLGTMICWHRYYKLGDTHHWATPTDFQRWWEKPSYLSKDSDYRTEVDEDSGHGEGGILIKLGLLDHSGLHIYAGGGPHWTDRAGWDSGTVGYYYLTKEKLLEEYNSDTPEHRATAEKVLLSEIEAYDQYLQGDVYGFEVYRVETCNLGEQREILLDSCWGFFGIEYAREEAKTAAESCKHLIEKEIT